MPTRDNGSIQLYQAALTAREHREFQRAEVTIAKGMKAFVAVGLRRASYTVTGEH